MFGALQERQASRLAERLALAEEAVLLARDDAAGAKRAAERAQHSATQHAGTTAQTAAAVAEVQALTSALECQIQSLAGAPAAPAQGRGLLAGEPASRARVLSIGPAQQPDRRRVSPSHDAFATETGGANAMSCAAAAEVQVGMPRSDGADGATAITATQVGARTLCDARGEQSTPTQTPDEKGSSCNLVGDLQSAAQATATELPTQEFPSSAGRLHPAARTSTPADASAEKAAVGGMQQGPGAGSPEMALLARDLAMSLLQVHHKADTHQVLPHHAAPLDWGNCNRSGVFVAGFEYAMQPHQVLKLSSAFLRASAGAALKLKQG